MRPHVYAVGDSVVIKGGLVRKDAAERTCRVVATSPASDRGEAQYLVRFIGENFERRIGGSDIDFSETMTSMQEADVSPEALGKPWLTSLKIRTGK